jgi:non-ribosomal peptide synthetase component F
LFASIKTFARERNSTPFMVLLAALAVLIYQRTGSTDVRIGTTVANRGQPGTDRVFGYFVNTLVLRFDLRPSMTFADLMARTRNAVVSAQANQDVPFEHLESLLESSHGAGAPLYQVMLNYRQQSESRIATNGLAIASWNGKQRAGDPGIAVSRLDVNFDLRELSTQVTGAVTYKTDLFDPASIVKFLEHYGEILQRVVGNEKARVADLSPRLRQLHRAR